MHDTNGWQLRGSACTRDRPGGLAALASLTDGIQSSEPVPAGCTP